MNVIIKFAHAPIECGRLAIGMIPITIKPKGSHITVVGEYLANLSFHKIKIGIIVGMITLATGFMAGISNRIIFTNPVKQGVVNMELYSLFLTSL